MTNAQGGPESCLRPVYGSSGLRPLAVTVRTSSSDLVLLSGRVTNETTGKDCTGPPRTGLTLTAQQGNDLLRAGESIPGIDVVAKRNGRVMFKTTTDAAGAFSFRNFAPGEYVLEFAQPASGTPAFGQAVTFVALKPHVELTMEATRRGNVLTGRVTTEKLNANCESVSRPRH